MEYLTRSAKPLPPRMIAAAESTIQLSLALRNCRQGKYEKAFGLDRVLREIGYDPTSGNVWPGMTIFLECFCSSLDEVNQWGAQRAAARGVVWKQLYEPQTWELA